MKLFFRKHGKGMPLFVLHGLFGLADNWHTLGKKWADNGFAVYLIDLRNHGHSPHSPKWNYKVMAEDIKALAEAENLNKIHLLGHSLGGKVAQFFATMFPDFLDKLIVADMGTKAYTTQHTDIIAALQGMPMQKIQKRADADDFLKNKITDWGTRQFLLKSLYRTENGYKWRFNLDVIAQKIQNVGEKLPENHTYDGKTLFIRGGKSNYILDKDWSGILQQFTNAKLETIADAGHWVHAENPKMFYKIAADFLSDSGS